MPRIQGLSETGVLTGNKLIKSGKTFVFSITLSWTGATAGDKVYLIDSTDVDESDPGKHEVVFVLDSANGTITKEWPQGKEFATGLVYQEGTAANVFAEMTYK
jgi:hypothetical protein